MLFLPGNPSGSGNGNQTDTRGQLQQSVGGTFTQLTSDVTHYFVCKMTRIKDGRYLRTEVIVGAVAVSLLQHYTTGSNSLQVPNYINGPKL